MADSRADAPEAAVARTTALVGLLLLALAAAACAPGGEDSPRGATPGAQADGDGSATGEPVHPAFTLDRQALAALLDGTASVVTTTVEADPRRFLELLDEVLDEPEDRTVLVDKTTDLGESYAPADLVELDTLADELALSRAGHRLTRDTAEALLEMNAAAERDGITLVVSSAYRSYAYQADLFARWVDELGLEEAERVSARPGTSQHQLGTTVDFGCICDEFASQPAGRWLAEHAWRYGFSLSYPEGYEDLTGYSYEPWHFRYIGRSAARLEREYFDGIQQRMLEFLHARHGDLEAARTHDR
ncbi:MAG: M15 family metallopeptidase [Spirochaetota bacterium]